MLLVFSVLCASCAPLLPPSEPIGAACTVTDGDSLRCGEERVRLLAIDPPELWGHCRAGRACAPDDPAASAEALRAATAGQPLTIQRLGRDWFGRTLAIVRAGSANLSWRQIASGMPFYRRDWDNRGAVRAECPDLTC